MLLRGLIGTVLRRIRLGQGRTLRDVAETARVSVPYLSEVERGRKEASSELLASICESLGLDLMDLLAEVRFELETERLAELASQPRTIGFTVSSQTELAPRPSMSGGGVALHAVSMAAA
ncbi:helix-turn-helix domain-containing protein [Kineosporia succinea]|uniref:Transcriptional regulator with XRE-family HTH domain n=1 Tax=Kineosporia succinea TaxID=84632 RepID=A0ABT9P0Q0_9ACTN|nr:helix-turn-helix transcriptional regulator [Kineosporia succinea]MDP9826251.1 transcriptional regulator with XRE-family HTH domain [Kineosporia succinea]